jgi:hypothetical protein
MSAIPPVHAGKTTVDCDRGDDLAAALRKAEKGDTTVITVTGTCIGSFSSRAPALKLVGQSPESSALVGSPGGGGLAGTVLRVSGSGNLVIENLGIGRGITGIEVAGSDRSIHLSNCTIFENNSGLVIGSGASGVILDTVVHSNDSYGIRINDGATASILDSIVRDNGGRGLVVARNATLALERTEVTGHGGVGIDAYLLSSVHIRDAQLNDNGQAHLVATDRSSILVSAGTAVGRSGDSTPVAAGVGLNSSLMTDTASDLHGDVFSTDDSYVWVDGATVHGSVFLRDFSRTKLVHATVEGTVQCQSASDAICDPSTVATTTGCDSAPPVCHDTTRADKTATPPPPSPVRRSGSSRPGDDWHRE